MKRCFKPAASRSGLMTVMLYQMLKALPTTYGMSGANAVTSSGCRFNAVSMAENNRGESNGRAISVFALRVRAPESSTFFRKQIRDRAVRTCRPDDLAKHSVALIA